MFLPGAAKLTNFIRRYSLPLSIIGITILFILYTYGLTENPPGFYQDESAFAYNAYLLAKTGHSEFGVRWPLFLQNFTWPLDRKSTRLNSSHEWISYAVFCLKKKKNRRSRG